MSESVTTDSATPPAAAAPRRRWPWKLTALLVLLVLAGLGGAIGWPLLLARVEGTSRGPSPAELARQIALVQDDVAVLRQKVAEVQGKVEGQGAAVTTAAADAGLAQRVAALEAAQGTARPSLPPHLAEQVQALGERLTALEKNSADAAALLRLSGRLDKVEATMRDIEARRSSAGALLLAVGQLRQAVDLAQPYDAEWRAVTVLAGKDDAIAAPMAALRPHAAAGIPTRPALAARFQALEPAIVRAEILPPGQGWWRQTLNRLMTLVTVRREDGMAAGDGAAAVAARVEGRLAASDLAAAAAEAGRLTGAPAHVAAPWLDDARARLAADQALGELSAQVIATSAAER